MREEVPHGDLRGRTVVVTGGNGGIGLGLATGVGRAGAEVAIWGRNETKNRTAITSLGELGIVAHAVVCDVSDEASVAIARPTARRSRTSTLPFAVVPMSFL